jgi:spermidine synthase
MANFRFYSGLFLITACTLMLQLTQTRILSVVAWYYLAFFAISMAMFGLTAGAIWVYSKRDRFTEKTLTYDLGYFSSIFAVSIAVCFAFQMSLALQSPGLHTTLGNIWAWLELSIAIAIPFFFSGIVVSLALTRSPFPIGRVYGFDLLGAAVGCLGVLWLLSTTDGPSTMLWIAAIASLGAWLFSGSMIGGEPAAKPFLSGLFYRHGIVSVVLIMVAFGNGLTDRGLQPLVVKDLLETPRTYIFKEWNSFSRISLMHIGYKLPPLWGASPKFPRSTRVDIRYATIDGAAGTPSYRLKDDIEELSFLRYDISNLAYYLPDRESVAIIGVGGGRDVQSAALFGIKDITGVEINPIIVKLLNEQPGFGDFTNLDAIPGVRLIVDEGRSWFARSSENFDIIEMSLIDTWAATGAGAFTLSENGLYTVEAWKTIMSRLSSDGVFTVSRWYSPDNLDESGRMISLAVAALMELGITEPRKHIFMASQQTVATLVVSVSEFREHDIAALEKASADLQHNVLLSPNRRSESATLDSIVSVTSPEELQQVTDGFELDLSPPTDDRPFFFNQLPLHKPAQALKIALERGLPEGAGVVGGNLAATVTLIILFLLALMLVIATIVIPMRHALEDVGRKLVTGGTLYFMLIGIGFMVVEIALLQRLSVFLGHPFYSLSVLLFSLILTTGLGSLLSDWFMLNTRVRFATWALLTGVYIASLPVWTPDIFIAYDGAALVERATIAVALIAPAGLLMGYGFPTGMRIISSLDRRPTPWFWGINGATGVVASIAAVALNIAGGISTTLTIGAVCYIALIPATLVFLGVGDSTAATE